LFKAKATKAPAKDFKKFMALQKKNTLKEKSTKNDGIMMMVDEPNVLQPSISL
jgi:hypothetical protein